MRFLCFMLERALSSLDRYWTVSDSRCERGVSNVCQLARILWQAQTYTHFSPNRTLGSGSGEWAIDFAERMQGSVGFMFWEVLNTALDLLVVMVRGKGFLARFPFLFRLEHYSLDGIILMRVKHFPKSIIVTLQEKNRLISLVFSMLVGSIEKISPSECHVDLHAAASYFSDNQ